MVCFIRINAPLYALMMWCDNIPGSIFQPKLSPPPTRSPLVLSAQQVFVLVEMVHTVLPVVTVMITAVVNRRKRVLVLSSDRDLVVSVVVHLSRRKNSNWPCGVVVRMLHYYYPASPIFSLYVYHHRATCIHASRST